MIEVLSYGLGPIGAAIARRVVARPALRLIGAVDLDAAKAGREVAQVAGMDRDTGLTVASTLGEAPPHGAPAVAIHATGSSLEAVAPELEALAAAGYDVISTCEELSHPWSRPRLASRLDEAAKAAGVSMLGGGINPGFLMDTLPRALSLACVTVERITVRRSVDTNRRRVPLQRKVGVGMTVSEFRKRAAAGELGHVGLRQSAESLAAGLGWRIDGYAEALEPVIAARDTETGLGVVPAGAVIGQHQVACASAAGRELIRYELDMYAGAAEVDAVTIDGEPQIRQVIEGGVNGDTGTEAVIVNLVPWVAAAPPGLLTMLDALPVGYSAGA